MKREYKRMKSTWLIVLGIALLIIYIFIYIFPSREEKLIDHGNLIVKNIENFHSRTGRLPNSLVDLGIEETLEGPIFYEKLDSSKYILWFGTTLGESVTYHSDREIWE
jgi:predicted PurR-regulated permease PerM